MADNGRPSDFNEEIAARICSEMSSGRSLRSICTDEGMPASSTVFLWLSKHQSFSEQYAKAQEDRSAAIAEDMFDIADEGNPDDVQRAKLRIDTRKWLLSKMAPKKYGDKVTSVLEGGDKPIETKEVGDRDLAKAVASLLSRGLNEPGS